jgi:hypothetical protein
MAINMLQDLGFFRWIFPGLKVTTDEDPVNGNIVATLATLLYTNDPNAVAKQLYNQHLFQPFLIRRLSDTLPALYLLGAVSGYLGKVGCLGRRRWKR